MQHQFDNILAFLEAVETGGISATAQRMGLSKSVVSKRGSDLEAGLKVELLYRSTRGVIATDKGVHSINVHVRLCDSLTKQRRRSSNKMTNYRDYCELLSQ